MNTIKKIFFTDIKNLFKNFLALVVAIGVCFLPALYAWFNIYSNWDPYGNTGNLKLAAVCLDEGFTDENGKYQNVGNEIIEELSGNDKVDWQFLDSQDEALEGVKSGYFYAAIIIEDGFTYNMYNMFVEDVTQPTLIFYENQKKNPVATKISDTVIGNVKSSINKKFVKVMVSSIFTEANDMYMDIENEGGVDAFITKLENVNSELTEYQDMLDKIIQANSVLNSTVDGAGEDAKNLQQKTQSSADALNQSANSIKSSADSLNDYKSQVDLTLDTITTMLVNIQTNLEQAQLSGDVENVKTATDQAVSDINVVITDLNALSASLSQTDSQDTVNTITTVIGNITGLQSNLEKLNLGESYSVAYADTKATETTATDSLSTVINDIQNTRNIIDNQMIPQVRNSVNNLEKIVSDASDLMNSMSGILGNMGDVFGSLNTTISSTNTSLVKTRDVLAQINERISTALDKANSVKEDEKVEALVNALSGDPDMYGEFFSEPVVIDTVAVYPIDNYGSAVAPFYTILSIWVGATILVAIVKTRVDKNKYLDASPSQLFMGRGLIFIVMGQIQTLITVLGDIFILKIQCIHPFLFWLAAALASLVFTLLIYALVHSFGDVGKAAAVVVLVLQIAGSSGTYPIELLPEFFQKVYIFFPFPYAINAMREAICGLYQLDYVKYLVELALFLIPALVIGLLLRIPFEGINSYMHKRMKDTEMM
ncbi:MAG: YhgE/Pip domain-containing protein [Lachnospiraceae bacterium]|nr:YhgE/Pip domain-containing protein [Lachnospiraceae bacterium]